MEPCYVNHCSAAWYVGLILQGLPEGLFPRFFSHPLQSKQSVFLSRQSEQLNCSCASCESLGMKGRSLVGWAAQGCQGQQVSPSACGWRYELVFVHRVSIGLAPEMHGAAVQNVAERI